MLEFQYLKSFSLVGLVFGLAIVAAPFTVQQVLKSPAFSLAQTQGMDRRQDRREDRNSDRKDRRNDRQDCRQDEGVVGKDKRDCKQDGRKDRNQDG